MLALGSSIFAPYSILAQRYRQNDHANRPPHGHREHHHNNITGTSRDSDIHMRQRDRTFREWRCSPSRFDQPPTESRSSRTLYGNYHSDGRKRANDQPHNQPHFPKTSAPQLRPAKPTPPLSYIPAPTVAATTAPRNVTAPSVSPARQHSPPPPSDKHTTLPPINATRSSSARDSHQSAPQLAVSTRHPHHHSYRDDSSGYDSSFSTASSTPLPCPYSSHPRHYITTIPAPAPTLAILAPFTYTSTARSQHTTTHWPMTPTSTNHPSHP